MDTPILGIDLGTTNSLVAYWQDGKAQLVKNALGSVLTPSVVSVDDDGSILVGAAARERLAEVLRAALVPPIPRRATKPTRASKLRRLDAKKRRSLLPSSATWVAANVTVLAAATNSHQKNSQRSSSAHSRPMPKLPLARASRTLLSPSPLTSTTPSAKPLATPPNWPD